MAERVENYVGQDLPVLFDGAQARAIFEEDVVRFRPTQAAIDTLIKYTDIVDLTRGMFPNSASVYLKCIDGNHCVQTFKTARFIRYINMGIAKNK